MEVLLVIKTIDEKMDLLEARVLELHPYDVPEILSLPISSASKHYLEWLRQGLAS
jgi:periplasmic divalent cation tolerance protein